MQEITTLTNSPNQLHRLVLENNETADFTLRFCPRVISWYYDIQYNSTTINGVKVVLTPNSLRQFRRVLPFGIAFYSDSQVEPFSIDDFANGRIKMGILTADEVKQIEQEVYYL